LTKFGVVLESIRESLAPAAATFAERCLRALAFPALMRPYEICRLDGKDKRSFA
jgi:hypothetical protein